MHTIGQGDWMIGFEELTEDNLSEIVTNAWDQREETRKTLKPIVDIEKQKARTSATILKDFLRPQ